jgi:excisionase family DNA binding protein
MPQQSSAWSDTPSPSLENYETYDTTLTTRQGSQGGERLLNAREVAETLGVSERWVRDHTTRRSPKIRGIKLGTLIRYRRADVDVFMEKLDTQATSRQNRFGV